MSILDKLRPQPEWKDDDPGVRLAAVHQLVADDDVEAADDILAQIVATDSDARVRQAAVERLTDPEQLARVVRDDADESVRATAVAILLELATSADDVEVGATALAALDDPRDLADVARAAASESMALAALARVNETKALGAVARRAVHGSVRLAAVARIADTEVDELAAVAIKSDHKDVAFAAIGQVADAPPSDPTATAGLEAIAAHARNKVAARRARTVLEERTTAAGSVLDVEAEREALCSRVESLVGSEDWSAVTDGLRETESAWAGLAAPVPSASTLDERFTAAVDALRSGLDAHHRALAEQARRKESHAAEAAPRVALCERVERIEGEQAPSDVEVAKAEWSALTTPTALQADEAAALARRFDDGCAAAVRRHSQLSEILTWRERVAADLEPLEAKVSAGALDEVSSTWRSMKKGWPALEGGWTDELCARARAIDDALKTVKDAARATDTQRRRANLSRLTQRCDQLEALVASDAMTLKHAERGYRDVRATLDHPPPLPTKQDRTALEVRLKALQEALYPKLHELREIDSWQRWANLNVQEELCQRVEALAGIDDLAEVAKRLREAVAQWKTAATVPRERAGELWQRFKTAHDAAYARCASFFAEQAEARKANLKKKTALCEQVEALATSTDWIKTASRIVALQAEWKSVGAVPRKHSKAIWNRFRVACDQFFERRKADFTQRKQVWAENLEKKEALCQQVEALADAPDTKAIAAVKQLQAEWRKIGPVKRTKSDAIWQRFRTACAKVSEKLVEQEEAAQADKVAEREAMCAELEALLPTEGSDPPPAPPDGLAVLVKDVRKRWQQAGGLAHRRAQSLGFRFHDAVGKLVAAFPEAFGGTDLDPQKSRRRMEQLCERVEKLPAATEQGSAGDLSPSELLAQRWRETLAANTMGAKVDPAAARRAQAEEVKRAQTEWKRLTPLHGDEGKRLAARFKDACDRFFSQRKSSPAPPSRQAG